MNKRVHTHKLVVFVLPGAGTGVPFHFHGPGFGEVVFGRKVGVVFVLSGAGTGVPFHFHGPCWVPGRETALSHHGLS